MNEAAEQAIKEGYTARREGRLPDALDTFSQALRLSRAAGDRVLLPKALKGFGQIQRDLGNRQAAIESYSEAAEIDKSAGEPLVLAHTVRHVGDILLEPGQFDSALPFFREALALYRELDIAAGVLEAESALRGVKGEPEPR